MLNLNIVLCTSVGLNKRGALLEAGLRQVAAMDGPFGNSVARVGPLLLYVEWVHKWSRNGPQGKGRPMQIHPTILNQAGSNEIQDLQCRVEDSQCRCVQNFKDITSAMARSSEGAGNLCLALSVCLSVCLSVLPGLPSL